MLSNETIDSAADKLAQYRANDSLPEILEQYATLIESYRRLKSDYEEEREGRERYKQLARGQLRNPFALVVVDGDGYIFDEGFLGSGEEGGSRAAKQLNDTIKASLQRKGFEDCQVMVRVYANLVGLSKVLAKNGLCGAEKRSLATFTAGFTRSYGLSDFIDAGELKENADYKLKAILRLYADNSQCKHIFFAACHDVGYISDLTPYRGNSERFTLIRTPSLRFHPEFSKLGINVEELPGVFRITPLPIDSVPAQSRSGAADNGKLGSIKSTNQSNAASASDGVRICSYYAVGKCRFGNSCENLHTDTGSSVSQTGRLKSPAHSRDGWRSASDLPNRHWGSSTGRNDPAFLPKPHEIPEGHIAQNEDQERLDAAIPVPTTEALKRIKEMSAISKFCNNHQLTNACFNENCEFDHTPIPEDLKPALEWLSRSMPCCRRGSCRKPKCVSGHVCQKMDCRNRGGKAYCRFPSSACLGDYRATSFPLGIVSTPATPSGEFEVEYNSEAADSVNGLGEGARLLRRWD